MADDAKADTSALDTYKDALKLAWDDFEIPPEEILMLDGLRERFGIDTDTHNKMEKEVLESIITEREKIGIDLNTLIGYCKKALDVHKDWSQCYERLIKYLEEDGKKEEAETYKKRLEELRAREKEGVGEVEEGPGEVEEEPSTTKEKHTLKCPKCKKEIEVDKWEFPMHIECPHCGAKGTLKKPPQDNGKTKSNGGP